MTRRFREVVEAASLLRDALQEAQRYSDALSTCLARFALAEDDGCPGASQILVVAEACAVLSGESLTAEIRCAHEDVRRLAAAIEALPRVREAQERVRHSLRAVTDLCLSDVVPLHEAVLQGQLPGLRRRVGAFSTPEQLARYVLKEVQAGLSERGLEQGFLEDGSYQDLGLTPPPGVDPSQPAVIILEPSAGSGAFLSQLIVFAASASGVRPTEERMAALLRRVRAYELVPAMAHICRLSLGATLRSLGYPSALAALVHVTAGDFLDAATRGAAELSGAAVVIGNPPYARASQHRSETMRRWLTSYRLGLEQERNQQPLADDYIKFMRAAQVLTAHAPLAAIGLVTNHTFLRGRLHRAMRASLRSSFPAIRVTDLQGNSKVRTPGRRDENVFGIAQGVAVAVMARGGKTAAPTPVLFTELRGRRHDKLESIADPQQLKRTLLPLMDNWAPTEPLPREYSDFLPLSELFEFYSVGGKPGDDGMLVGFERDQLLSQLREARDQLDAEARGATEAARRLSQRPIERPFEDAGVIHYAYRPFDDRVAYYEPEIWTRPLRALYEHVDGRPILLTTRIVKDERFAHVFATRRFPDVIALSTTSSVNCYAFPQSTMCPERLGELTGMNLTPDEAFAYVYGALHSAAYRQRYLGGLRQDFPRIPVMRDPALIASLVARGGRLLSLHLGEASPKVPGPRFVDGGDRRILSGIPEDPGQLVEGEDGAQVGVNDCSYFACLPKEAWSFRVGGYQVCRKWLLDRRKAGRPLSDQDIHAYCDIVARIAETHSLQVDIDALIERFGGFPEAVRRPVR